jgi:sugar phosphate isomerase/epimerase
MVQFGVCVNLAEAGLPAAAEFDFIELTALAALEPDKNDAEWEPRLEALLALPLPRLVCSQFFPGSAHLVGPERDLVWATEWADRVFERLTQIGGRVQVLGSGQARTPPNGYSIERALEEFKELVRRLAPLAARHGVRIAVEHLRKEETPILNTVVETAALVREINHPAVGLLVDAYHLAEMGEPWSVLGEARGLVVHTHWAAAGTRQDPVSQRSDLRPFLRQLAAIGYDGTLSLECGWQDFGRDGKVARELLAGQWTEVMAEL